MVNIAVGQSASAAVTEGGEVYLWGWSFETPVPRLVEEMKGEFFTQVITVFRTRLATHCCR